jgi:histone-lysine N-methyltransferase SETMAR
MPSPKKIIGTVFWDSEGCMFIEFLEPGKTINAARYVQTLLKIRHALHDKSPGRKAILQHDNAQPHLEKIENMGWEVLPHPLCSPDLAPSDYDLFGFVKNQMRGQCYETNEALQTAVCQCLQAAGMEFYHKGIFQLPERSEKCVQRNGDYVEK